MLSVRSNADFDGTLFCRFTLGIMVVWTRDVLSLLLSFLSLAAVLGIATAVFCCTAHPPRVSDTNDLL